MMTITSLSIANIQTVEMTTVIILIAYVVLG